MIDRGRALQLEEECRIIGGMITIAYSHATEGDRIRHDDTLQRCLERLEVVKYALGDYI